MVIIDHNCGKLDHNYGYIFLIYGEDDNNHGVDIGRPRCTVGKASASEARGPGFEPPWLVQRSRCIAKRRHTLIKEIAP